MFRQRLSKFGISFLRTRNAKLTVIQAKAMSQQDMSTVTLLLFLSCLCAFVQTDDRPVTFNKEELKKRLTPMQYHVTQEKGTEQAFTGELEKNKEKGTYKCVVCGNILFKSEHKYDSGSGWPSFYTAVSKDAVEAVVDKTHGMERTEVVCDKCKAHLGHVFTDGPAPTGERYCMNSASLSFEKSGGK